MLCCAEHSSSSLGNKRAAAGSGNGVVRACFSLGVPRAGGQSQTNLKLLITSTTRALTPTPLRPAPNLPEAAVAAAAAAAGGAGAAPFPSSAFRSAGRKVVARATSYSVPRVHARACRRGWACLSNSHRYPAGPVGRSGTGATRIGRETASTACCMLHWRRRVGHGVFAFVSSLFSRCRRREYITA